MHRSRSTISRLLYALRECAGIRTGNRSAATEPNPAPSLAETGIVLQGRHRQIIISVYGQEIVDYE